MKHRVTILRSYYSETDADGENLQHSTSIPTQFRYGAKIKDLLFRTFQACETFFQALLSLPLGLELIQLSHILVYVYYCAPQKRKLTISMNQIRAL